jgi:hypothetical protein
MSISKQIIEVLDNLCQKFGIVIDWSAENIMPYLKELCSRFINYEIMTSMAWIILMLVICAISWIIFATTFKSSKKVCWNEDYFIVWVNEISLVFSIVWSVISIIVIVTQAFDIIEAICLPEKTIYDFISYQISLHN